MKLSKNLKGYSSKFVKVIIKVLGSHIFLMLMLALLYGITAISPDIWKNPIVFGNYIGFIIINVIIQEAESRETDKKYQAKIDDLQKQIDELKK